MIKRSVPHAVALGLIVLQPGCATTKDAPAAAASASHTAQWGAPRPGAPEALQEFGRFAGRWECRIEDRRSDGTWYPRATTGIWTWFYTLNGAAVQDIWEPRSSGATPVYSTNLRIYDADKGEWHAAWTNTEESQFELWQGGRQGDDLVMQGKRDGYRTRIRFFEITPRTFEWRYDVARPEPESEWNAVLRMHCTRIA